jgi:hypothetical protein
MQSDPSAAVAVSCIRTLRLKVKPESYPWLDAAAVEINQVWNYANEVSGRAARPFAGPQKWLTGYDLDKLTAGSSEYFEHIGSDCWWLCLPVSYEVEKSIAPEEDVGIDLGLKDTAATSDGDTLEAGHFYRKIEQRIAQAQRRGHRRQAKRLHRRAARRRKHGWQNRYWMPVGAYSKRSYSIRASRPVEASSSSMRETQREHVTTVGLLPVREVWICSL